jgi:AraC-like DNA-binding protein
MADIAYMSPYHFCRVFHQLIGIPPGEFLATLRLDAAKRLLLTTSLSVTDICYEVGYSGLGSFTTRFTQLVGLPPRLLRHLARNVDGPLLNASQPSPCAVSCSRGLSGFISGPAAFSGSICAGLFPKPIPQGRPVACTMLFAPGWCHIDPVPDGRYYLMVAAFPRSLDPNAYLLSGEALLVGVQGPLDVLNGSCDQQVEVTLRSHRVTDPPIIVALPFI